MWGELERGGGVGGEGRGGQGGRRGGGEGVCEQEGERVRCMGRL